MAVKLPPILQKKYPAKQHAHNVLSYLQKHHPSSHIGNSLFYLESARTRMNEDNDQEAPFRQRRYFFYLSGCGLPDSALVYNAKENRSTLFIPPVDDDEVIWSGLPLSPKEALQTYDVDEVLTTNDLPGFFSSHASSSSSTQLLAIEGQTDLPSNPTTQPQLFSNIDLKLLKTAIEEARVIKTDYEVALIRHANTISGLAHKQVMRETPTATNECELEALFVCKCAHHGAKYQAYSPIVASGTDAATLHYVKNNKELSLPVTPGPGADNLDRATQKKSEQPLNLLIDAGCEFSCYASDVTRTFPVNGKFTAESRAIYSIVLKMQKACIGMLKAGVEWDDCHRLAHQTLIEGLVELGILRSGFSVEEIMQSRVSTAFLPHGLGHYLGMDTHDSGGHANYSDKDPMFRYLRVRAKVPAGAVITVEPGCYFCRFIIEPWLKMDEGKKYINENVLDRYWTVGGVRIEDDLLVTAQGYDNLTEAPKEIDEIEALMKER